MFFDNLAIQQRSGPITEETHYYPFGLTMAGISDQAAQPSTYPTNKIKFQKQELQNKEFSDWSGLEMYALKFRFDGPLTPEQKQRLYDVLDRCPVHKLMTTTEVRITALPLE